MSVYLGDHGCIELKRTGLDRPFTAEIDPSSVRVNATKPLGSVPPPPPDYEDSEAACWPDKAGAYNSSDVTNGAGTSLCTDGTLPAGTTTYDDADVLPRSDVLPAPTTSYDPHNTTLPFVKGGRFSFDFPAGTFLSGDLLDFSTKDGDLIPFLDGWNQPYRTAWALCVPAATGDYKFSDCDNGTDSICDDAPTYASSPWDPGTADFDNADIWVRDQISVDFEKTMDEVYDQMTFYVHVDEAGGITLYRTFTDAVSGEKMSTVLLRQPTQTTMVEVVVANVKFRVIGQVQSFTLNTDRESVDVTELGESFRARYGGLISGSGSVTALFEYEQRDCDDSFGHVSKGIEMPIYINQLMLRSAIGSEFDAKLTLVGRGEKPGGMTKDIDDQVFQTFSALVTNCGMAFEPGQPVRVTFNYVTTGLIRLHAQMKSDYLTQEQDPNNGRIGFEEYSEDGFLLHTE